MLFSSEAFEIHNYFHKTGRDRRWMCVLVSEGTELILFLVTGTVLCFGFGMRIMLVTRWCFSCCWAVLTLTQGLFSFSHSPASEEAGGAPEAGRAHNQDSWPQLATHTVWCHGEHINWGELDRGRHTCAGTALVSVSGWWATALCITCFEYSFIIVFPSFSVLLNFTLTHEFYLFSSPLPHPTAGGEVSERPCGV